MMIVDRVAPPRIALIISKKVIAPKVEGRIKRLD